jgi:methylamine---glutamate N-methyltransferase subunit C
MRQHRVVDWAALSVERPYGTVVQGLDLVVIQWPDGENVSVLYGRCLHRGALLADASVRGDDIVCGVHGWDFQYRTGISAYNPTERLHRFSAWIEDGGVWIDLDEVDTFLVDNPQPYDRDSYQGAYQDFSGTSVEPHVKAIREMASHGLDRLGHHGAMGAMGVPADELPKWDDIQIVTAQLARPPLLDDEVVDTSVVIGSRAAKPVELDIPLFVSDMSFGSLSREAKVSLARGAELAGTGICSGEGGMLADEQAANSRYFYELASSRFGFSWDKVTRAQAFHFKGGQAAKTGTGGHLPGNKVTAEIAEVRGLEPGQDAISPSRFPEWTTPAEIAVFADEVRDRTGGIPIGYKLSAQHVEDDLEAALDVGVDYVIVDGRGGATGAAPLLFRDNISVPTIPALARARRFLDENAPDVTLVITGGLRTPADFVKALALGADAIALANAPLQAIGCLGMRACNTNNCPVGIATQQEHLRDRLPADEAAQRLHRYFEATVELMKLLARACGHRSLSDFSVADLTTWKPDMAALSGVPFGGVGGTVS